MLALNVIDIKAHWEKQLLTVLSFTCLDPTFNEARLLLR